MKSNIKINKKRLINSIEEMAKIGKTAKGGVNRQALTDLDKIGRDLFIKWCKKENLAISIDKMGNIFAKRDGKNNKLPSIMSGSHLDTQPTGGKYDGALGVLCALEVIRSLNDINYITESPLEIVVWTNEEGCRFPPSMTGSAVFSGQLSLKKALDVKDLDGNTFGKELNRINYNGKTNCKPRKIGAFLETHIEQGPILEMEKKVIGVVVGAQAQRWYEVNIIGMEAHAGPTPMNKRKDALVGASKIVLMVNSIGCRFQPGGCATAGVLNIKSPSRNVIPGECFLTIDFRHPSDTKLKEMDNELRNEIKNISKNYNLKISIKQIMKLPSISFDSKIRKVIKQVSTNLNFQHKEIISGAGHDAVNINKIAPSGMIFIPCVDGISHNEIEKALEKDIYAGAEVLLHSMIELADAP